MRVKERHWARPGQRAGSRYEEQLFFQISHSELPQPELQYRFAPPRMWRFDFAWPDGRIALEVDGGRYMVRRARGGLVPVGQHMTDADYERNNEAQLLGWTVLRVTPQMVEQGMALKLLERALKR